jgi:hypothetical protein
MAIWTRDREDLTIRVLLAAGAVERMLWNLLRPGYGSSGEAWRVAVSLAEGRGFADAYHAGQGATAHLLPISPAIGGAVYAIFGVDSLVAECILATWSIGLALIAYWFAYRIFGHIGVPLHVRLAGLAWSCLVPPYISQEAVDFRLWEGGLATALAMVTLERTLRAARGDPTPPLGRALTLGGLLGLLFFVNPPLGVGTGAAVGVFAMRHWKGTQLSQMGAAGAATVLLLVTPWTLRNQSELGAPILLRSNSGLELALTNHPETQRGSSEKDVFLGRLREIHPANSESAYQKMQAAGGEVAYFRRLGREAVLWIKSNPTPAISSWAGHFREMFVPNTWKFVAYERSRIGLIKAAIAQLTGTLAIFGTIVALYMGYGGLLYPIILTAVVALLISPFQPVVRYMYLIYPILAQCAALPLLLLVSMRRAPQPRRANMQMDGPAGWSGS